MDGIARLRVRDRSACHMTILISNLCRPPFAPDPRRRPCRQTTYFLTGVLRMLANLVTPITPLLPRPSKTLDFASATSNARAILDFFTYNTASPRAGIVNLNTRNGPVLASIISGAWLNDPGSENTPPAVNYLVSQTRRPRRSASHCSRNDEYCVGHGPALTRADVTRLAAVAAARCLLSESRTKQSRRSRARWRRSGQARTWNLMIDVIAQTGSTNRTPKILRRVTLSSKARSDIGWQSRLIATVEPCWDTARGSD